MKFFIDMFNVSFCESVEVGYLNQSELVQIVQKLGIIKQSVRMDLQVKYGFIVRGVGDIYLCLLIFKIYQEKIWDYVVGDLIVREVGGEVIDIKGNCLNFGVGRMLVINSGVIVVLKVVYS